jgi:3-hydroxyacyl-[acyl-carrier-protein] dehydratase
MSDTPPTIAEVRDIFKLLPHRYPFLLVDRVLDFEKAASIHAIKNVTVNEPFFPGHFPGLPVMPGVLILEALAQAGGLLIALSDIDMRDKLFMFTGIDKVRFRKPSYPGDQLHLRCTDIRHKLQLWKMNAKCVVDGEVRVEASLTAAIVDREEA